MANKIAVQLIAETLFGHDGIDDHMSKSESDAMIVEIASDIAMAANSAIREHASIFANHHSCSDACDTPHTPSGDDQI
jgi:hypothetical protein